MALIDNNLDAVRAVIEKLNERLAQSSDHAEQDSIREDISALANDYADWSWLEE